MNSFSEKYSLLKTEFEQYLYDFTDSFDYYPPLSEAMKYSLNAGGKRLRPVIMIASAQMLGLDSSRVMPLAAAIECIHTYSLIHDDLPCMDDDSLRRGKPTSHIVFGEDMAVLAGDGLLNLAMETALKSIEKDNCENYLKAVELLFESSGSLGMVGGQAIDVKNTGSFQTLEELKNMHSKKTGALFLASCLCPALILGCNSDIISRLYSYAENLGLLFQIKDDILDVTGDVQSMGKSIGKDAAEGKSTFISLMGVAESTLYAGKIADEARKALLHFGDKGEFLSELIQYILERKN